MKKQIVTRQDIRRELLFKINKAKMISIFLTIFTAVAILFYILFLINFADIMVEYTNGHLVGTGFRPMFGLIFGPLVILILVIFLLDFYYIDLYKAATGKFSIIEEKLYQKKKEQISYYRRIEEENSLYFRFGRVSVENEIYSRANTGDTFYIIVLRAKKAPLLVYHTKYHEIENP